MPRYNHVPPPPLPSWAIVLTYTNTGSGVVVATDPVAVGTPKEGVPVKAKVGGVVVTDAAGGGGVPATAALFWSYYFHRGFFSVI
jgi:hypothetical protein